MKWIYPLIIALALQSFAFAQDFKIYGVPAEPMRFLDKQTNTIKGFDIDIIDHILSKLGINYSVLLIDSSPRIEQAWIAGDFEMLLTYSYKKSRRKYLIYPKESHVTVSWNFFIRKEDVGKVTFNTYDDLKNLRVGASTGKSYSPEFINALKKYPYTDIIPQDELQIKKLLHKRIDIVPLETFAAVYQAREEGYIDKIDYLKKPVAQKKYYNLFVKNSKYPHLNDLVVKYDQQLKQMKQDGTLKKIYAKWGMDY